LAIEIKLVSPGDEACEATRALLARFRSLAAAARARHPQALPARSGGDPLALAEEQLALLLRLDEDYGGEGPLPLADADQLAATLLATLAELDQALRNAGEDAVAASVDGIVLGAAFWALRHGLPLDPVEPVANALARQANAAPNRQTLAATFGLMQGVVLSVAPRLEADLERSNPERPWRVLHANLAITAIRTEDPAIMDVAFDALDGALPGERAGFYAEALALALAPGIAPAVRERIEARHLKWTAAR
jgi:hypothetical protein